MCHACKTSDDARAYLFLCFQQAPWSCEILFLHSRSESGTARPAVRLSQGRSSLCSVFPRAMSWAELRDDRDKNPQGVRGIRGHQEGARLKFCSTMTARCGCESSHHRSWSSICQLAVALCASSVCPSFIWLFLCPHPQLLFGGAPAGAHGFGHNQWEAAGVCLCGVPPHARHEE